MDLKDEARSRAGGVDLVRRWTMVTAMLAAIRGLAACGGGSGSGDARAETLPAPVAPAPQPRHPSHRHPSHPHRHRLRLPRQPSFPCVSKPASATW